MPYHATTAINRPRQVDHDLKMFGCVSCNLCVTVCPNDAMFRTPGVAEQGLRHQYFIADLCNECGNRTTFCPERGDPAQIKPRLYLDPDAFAASTGQRFLVSTTTCSVVDTADVDAGARAAVSALLHRPEGLPLSSRLVFERRIPYLKWGHLLRFDADEVRAWLADAHVDCQADPDVRSNCRWRGA